LKYTDDAFELILVDNASTDGTIEYLGLVRSQCSEDALEGDGSNPSCDSSGDETEVIKIGDIRQAEKTFCKHVEVICNEKNLGFAAGNNLGISVGRGDYILLMNNDVVVTPSWLTRLICCMERDPRIGIVGPMTNYVSGPQLVEDVTYDKASLHGLNEFATEFAAQHKRHAQPFFRVVGFCMLIRRSVSEKIGGLDEAYGLGNFEDDDFCLRAALAGFESWIAKDCFVHHFGSRTFVGANIDYTESLCKNWEIFKRKWELPSDLPYGSHYDLTSVLRKSFDPDVHYVALEGKTPVIPLKEQAHGLLEKRLQEGEQCFSEGRYEDAEKIFREVIRHHPDHPKAHNDLACLFWNMGRRVEALREITKAMEIDSKDLDVIWNAGHFLKEAGRDQEAREIYASYLKRHPEEMEVAETLRQWEKASNMIEGDSSGEKKWFNDDGRLHDAKSLLREGYFREAEQVLREILRDHPESHVAHNDLACLMWETGRTEEALQELGRALEIDSDHRDAVWNLGQFLTEMGRDHDAKQVYRSFLERHPEDLEMYEALGQFGELHTS
jgi:GT2 family glycosyltransferase/Flp pilus assembly protein TadD